MNKKHDLTSLGDKLSLKKMIINCLVCQENLYARGRDIFARNRETERERNRRRRPIIYLTFDIHDVADANCLTD